ncbi:MAG TPA: four helix bundle protein [Acidobacteriota bacterium]|nr:four helix bundle protein [Acidobacteriota bacterium]
MNACDLKQRTMRFAIEIVRLVEALPKSQTGSIVARQLLRAGTSVGANYRSACCAKSRADFIANMAIVQ